MGLYRADSVALSYSNVEAAKQWWIDTFGCKVVRVPQDWDNPLLQQMYFQAIRWSLRLTE